MVLDVKGDKCLEASQIISTPPALHSSLCLPRGFKGWVTGLPAIVPFTAELPRSTVTKRGAHCTAFVTHFSTPLLLFFRGSPSILCSHFVSICESYGWLKISAGLWLIQAWGAFVTACLLKTHQELFPFLIVWILVYFPGGKLNFWCYKNVYA